MRYLLLDPTGSYRLETSEAKWQDGTLSDVLRTCPDGWSIWREDDDGQRVRLALRGAMEKHW